MNIGPALGGEILRFAQDDSYFLRNLYFTVF